MTRTFRSCLGLAALTASLWSSAPGSAQPTKPAPTGGPAQSGTTAPSAAPVKSGAPVTSAAPVKSGAPGPSTAPTASAAPVTTTAPTSEPSAAATSAALYAAEEADRTFQEGRKALKEDRFADALTLFQRSYDLDPTPGTLLNIALAEEKLGKPASALRHFERVASLLPPDDDRLPIAREGIARTAPRAPRLQIDRAAGAPPTIAVSLDGAAMAANAIGVEQPLDPGIHIVTTHVFGFEDGRYELTLAEGQHLSVAVGPGKRAQADDSPQKPVTAAAGLHPTAVAVLALGGAAVASLGAGAITGILAISKNNELSALTTGQTACAKTPTECAADAARLRGEALGFAHASTGTFVVGGLAAAASALIYFTVGKNALSVGATAGPNGGGLTAHGRF